MLRAARNGQSAGRRKPPQRLNGKHLGPGEDTVYSPYKYRETEGIKDIKSDSYGASWLKKIDKAQFEDYGNAQGADKVIKVYNSTVSKPKNPTNVTTVTVRNQGSSPVTIAPGSTATLPVVSSSLYDCTTWRDYPDPDAYDYYGYRYSRHDTVEETKTVLAQSGSTAVQNFSFEGMEDTEL